MKIFHIAECAGGVERYLELLLPRLNEDFEQILVCSYNYEVKKYFGIVDAVEQIDMKQSFSPIKVFFQVRQIRRLVRKYQPDIVYCHSSFAGGLGRLSCIGLPCKVVYNPHGWAYNVS